MKRWVFMTLGILALGIIHIGYYGIGNNDFGYYILTPIQKVPIKFAEKGIWKVIENSCRQFESFKISSHTKMKGGLRIPLAEVECSRFSLRRSSKRLQLLSFFSPMSISTPCILSLQWKRTHSFNFHSQSSPFHWSGQFGQQRAI